MLDNFFKLNMGIVERLSFSGSSHKEDNLVHYLNFHKLATGYWEVLENWDRGRGAWFTINAREVRKKYAKAAAAMAKEDPEAYDAFCAMKKAYIALYHGLKIANSKKFRRC